MCFPGRDGGVLMIPGKGWGCINDPCVSQEGMGSVLMSPVFPRKCINDPCVSQEGTGVY